MQIMLMYLRLEGAALVARSTSFSRALAQARALTHVRARTLAYGPPTRTSQEHNRDYLFSELGADDGAADAGGAGAGMAE